MMVIGALGSPRSTPVAIATNSWRSSISPSTMLTIGWVDAELTPPPVTDHPTAPIAITAVAPNTQ